jgi:hypothetical protein
MFSQTGNGKPISIVWPLERLWERGWVSVRVSENRRERGRERERERESTNFLAGIDEYGGREDSCAADVTLQQRELPCPYTGIRVRISNVTRSRMNFEMRERHEIFRSHLHLKRWEEKSKQGEREREERERREMRERWDDAQRERESGYLSVSFDDGDCRHFQRSGLVRYSEQRIGGVPKSGEWVCPLIISVGERSDARSPWWGYWNEKHLRECNISGVYAMERKREKEAEKQRERERERERESMDISNNGNLSARYEWQSATVGRDVNMRKVLKGWRHPTASIVQLTSKRKERGSLKEGERGRGRGGEKERGRRGLQCLAIAKIRRRVDLKLLGFEIFIQRN